MDGSCAGTIDSDILGVNIGRGSAWRLLNSLRTVVTDNTFVGASGCNARPRVYRGPEVRVVILVRVGVTDKPFAGVEIRVNRSRTGRINSTGDCL